MSTRALVIVETGKDEYKVIYNHFDGYPDRLGRTLKKHYETLEKATALVEMGDASFIDNTLEKSTFYGRDRGESNTECSKGVSAYDA